MCMIDIPHDTFRPYNNAKCDVIFIQKNRPQQEKILGVYVKNIGHNHAGETVFEYDIATNTFDNTKVNDDIPISLICCKMIVIWIRFNKKIDGIR